ncbi:YhcN/YlaJ family sporulation lipoprotein [Fictibacillus sp. Mic-4]|uniref:YhcN/YlaJ family sporulation lipoprotein n=1 Tax=Fictibacillus TaxID=1329200 RepID=UPI001FDF4B5E|nr:YhcN/YlaJ family sporulation lipoprotein [Fictibacillus gelatini]
MVCGLTVLTLAAGLAGCNTKKNALNTRYNNDVRPIGYYTNEPDNRYDLTKGPITDMADNDRYDVTRRPGTTITDNRMNVTSYDRNYNGALAKRITDKVTAMKDVNDAHVIITDNTVIVGYTPKHIRNRTLDDKVHDAVKRMVPNRDVDVVSDKAVVNRIKNVDKRLRQGRPYNEVSSDVNAILNDITNAVKRPFQNNVR